MLKECEQVVALLWPWSQGLQYFNKPPGVTVITQFVAQNRKKEKAQAENSGFMKPHLPIAGIYSVVHVHVHVF